MAIKSTDLSGELYNIKYYIDDESGIKGYLVPLSEVGKARYVKDLEQEKCIYNVKYRQVLEMPRHCR